MKDTTLIKKKRRDLYALYRKGLEEGRFSSMRDAGNYLATIPAPCFYTSPEAASLLVGRLLDGRSLSDLNSSKRRLVRRLHEEYKKYLSDHPGTKLSRVRIMNELVDRPAPEFYMTPDAIRRALRIEIQDTKRKMGWGE